jgi:hypothetical protein
MGRGYLILLNYMNIYAGQNTGNERK